MRNLAKIFSAKMVGAMKEKIRKERGKGMQISPRNQEGIQEWTAWAVSVAAEVQLMVDMGSTLHGNWHRLWRRIWIHKKVAESRQRSRFHGKVVGRGLWL